jgi:hypothetical protein
MMSKKKLIEVALPLEAINKASAREKSIRHGHPTFQREPDFRVTSVNYDYAALLERAGTPA